MDRCTNWFQANCLQINNSKTEEIIFNLSICNEDLKVIKLLGFHLDQRLSWVGHTEKLCTKLSRVIYLMYKLRNNVSLTLLMYAYFAFFHSHLTYGILLWGNSPGSTTVFRWQKKAIRCIASLARRDSCKGHFEELNIMTVPSLYIYSCLLNVKENLNKYDLRKTIHEHNTRTGHTIDLPYSRLSKVHNSHQHLGLRLFNRLPETAHSIPYSKFKNVLGEWIKEKAYYSVKEYLESDISDLKF